MNLKFKDFMKSKSFNHSLMENGGAPQSPENPDKSNSDHFKMVKQQMGLEDDGFDSALKSGIMSVWKVPDYSEKWGFLVVGPCSALITPENGMYKVVFQLEDKKKLSPKSFIMPYKNGEKPYYYDGPISDKTEFLTSDEIQDLVSLPLQGGMGGMLGVGMGGGM